MKNFLLLALAVCVCAGAAAARPVPALDSLPVWFEPAADDGAFVSRRAEGQLRLTPTSASLAFAAGPGQQAARLQWRLEGAHPSTLTGLSPLPGHTNYFLGRDRAQWRTRVPQFQRVQARGVYPGVDVVWYAQGRLLEYDFVVAPGADASVIGFRLDGASPRLESSGDLVYSLNGLEVRQHRPVAYQLAANGARTPIEASYRLAASGAIGFSLGAYDPARPLVIDPVFSYAGYIGGVRLESARAVVVDPADGGLWIAGASQSDLSLPEETNVFQRKFGGFVDAFVAKVMPADEGGGRVVYWTHIGGTGNDEATAMALGADGALVIAGTSNSLDFPPAGTPYRVENPQNDIEAFLVRFDPRIDGPFAITYSTLYGGKGREFPQAVATDGRGKVALVGYSNSGELPKGEATNLQRSNRGGQDIFVAYFDLYASSGDATLVKDTFLGGNSTDVANSVAFDAQGRVVLAGVTMSTDFPLAGDSYQSELPGFSGGFIARIDFSRSGLDQLDYATYFGGPGLDAITNGVLDPQGRLWLTGYTSSTGLPTTGNAVQSFRAGGFDSFLLVADITKPSRDFLHYFTYFGAGGTDIPYAIAIKPDSGTALIGGYTDSNDFPVKNPMVATAPSVRILESFFAAIDTTVPGAGGLLYSVPFGGKARDIIYSAGFGPDGSIALVGTTASDDLPTASPTGKVNPPGLDTGWYLRLLP